MFTVTVMKQLEATLHFSVLWEVAQVEVGAEVPFVLCSEQEQPEPMEDLLNWPMWALDRLKACDEWPTRQQQLRKNMGRGIDMHSFYTGKGTEACSACVKGTLQALQALTVCQHARLTRTAGDCFAE